MKIAFIPQEILNGLKLALNEYDFIRRHEFRDPNFKRYSYIKSIASILVKSQKYYAGQKQRSFSILLILKTFITPSLRPIFLLNTFFYKF
jgi:hypothetical protein